MGLRELHNNIKRNLLTYISSVSFLTQVGRGNFPVQGNTLDNLEELVYRK